MTIKNIKHHLLLPIAYVYHDPFGSALDINEDTNLLYTHDCIDIHGSNTLIKFVNNTTVVRMIGNNDEVPYSGEVRTLAQFSDTHLNFKFNPRQTRQIHFQKGRTILHSLHTQY